MSTTSPVTSPEGLPGSATSSWVPSNVLVRSPYATANDASSRHQPGIENGVWVTSASPAVSNASAIASAPRASPS
jgi:hypothetical protein